MHRLSDSLRKKSRLKTFTAVFNISSTVQLIDSFKKLHKLKLSPDCHHTLIQLLQAIEDYDGMDGMLDRYPNQNQPVRNREPPAPTFTFTYSRSITHNKSKSRWTKHITVQVEIQVE